MGWFVQERKMFTMAMYVSGLFDCYELRIAKRRYFGCWGGLSGRTPFTSFTVSNGRTCALARGLGGGHGEALRRSDWDT